MQAYTLFLDSNGNTRNSRLFFSDSIMLLGGRPRPSGTGGRWTDAMTRDVTRKTIRGLEVGGFSTLVRIVVHS